MGQLQHNLVPPVLSAASDHPNSQQTHDWAGQSCCKTDSVELPELALTPAAPVFGSRRCQGIGHTYPVTSLPQPGLLPMMPGPSDHVVAESGHDLRP
jgi:hypothetical protein